MDATGNQKLFFFLQRMDGVHPYGGHLFSPQFPFPRIYSFPPIHIPSASPWSAGGRGLVWGILKQAGPVKGLPPHLPLSITTGLEVHTWPKLDQSKVSPRHFGETETLSSGRIFDAKFRSFCQSCFSPFDQNKKRMVYIQRTRIINK